MASVSFSKSHGTLSLGADIVRAALFGGALSCTFCLVRRVNVLGTVPDAQKSRTGIKNVFRWSDSALELDSCSNLCDLPRTCWTEPLTCQA